MKDIKNKTQAVLEVVAVFILTLAVTGVFFASPLGDWERQVLQRFFLTYALMIATPLLILVLMRRNLAAYGISLKNFKYHLDIALTCFIPYSAAMALGFAVDLGNQVFNRLLDVVIAIAVLFILARLLKSKPSLGSMVVMGIFLLYLPHPSPSAGTAIGRAVSALIYYTFFLGPGEELLFRGYIQSRLNESFDRPYHFLGAKWGWGVIITSLLFGLFHVLNLTSLYEGRVNLSWWGMTSFFWGLVFGFVREKTGSIVAPAILHGLPQGIAWAFLGL